MNESSKLCEYLKSHPILNCGSLVSDAEGRYLEKEDCEKLRTILNEFFVPVKTNTPASKFHEVYEPVRSFVLKESNGESIIIGDESENKVCAFCGRIEPEVHFNSIAHLLPQLTGCKEVITKEECDACNSRMGREYEPHLASLLMDNRAINCMKSSSAGTVKLQPRGSKCRIGGQDFGKPLEMVVVEGDDSIQWAFRKDNTLRLKYESPGYIPQKASKSIAKSVYLTIPKEQRNNYESLRNWIDDASVDAKSTIINIHIPGPPLSITTFGVWRTRNADSDYTPLVALFSHGNVVLLWSYPEFGETKYDIIYPHIPKPRYSGLNLNAVSITSFDSTRQSESNKSLDFHYEYAVCTQNITSLGSLVTLKSTTEVHVFTADCELIHEADSSTHVKLSNGDIAGHIGFVIKPAGEIGVWFDIGSCNPNRERLKCTFRILSEIEKGGHVLIQQQVPSTPYSNIMEASIPLFDSPIIAKETIMYWELLGYVEEYFSVLFDTTTIEKREFQEIAVIGSLLRSEMAVCRLLPDEKSEIYTVLQSDISVETCLDNDDIDSLASYEGHFVRDIQGVHMDIPVMYQFYATAINTNQHDNSMVDIIYRNWKMIRSPDKELVKQNN